MVPGWYKTLLSYTNKCILFFFFFPSPHKSIRGVFEINKLLLPVVLQNVCKRVLAPDFLSLLHLPKVVTGRHIHNIFLSEDPELMMETEIISLMLAATVS